jgi:bifunctional non-homologous end joining protein LigD
MSRVPRTTDQSRPLAFISPLKPTLAATPPEGDQWLHEVKHDGYRTELIIERAALAPTR